MTVLNLVKMLMHQFSKLLKSRECLVRLQAFVNMLRDGVIDNPSYNPYNFVANKQVEGNRLEVVSNHLDIGYNLDKLMVTNIHHTAIIHNVIRDIVRNSD